MPTPEVAAEGAGAQSKPSRCQETSDAVDAAAGVAAQGAVGDGQRRRDALRVVDAAAAVAPELPLKVLLVTISVTEVVVDAAAAAAGRVAA